MPIPYLSSLKVPASLAIFLVSTFVLGAIAFGAYSVTPDGFDCGYVTGNSRAVAGRYVSFDSMPTRLRGCVGTGGYFFENEAQSSKAKVYVARTRSYDLDFVWSVRPEWNTFIDQSTGVWGGFGRFEGLAGEAQWVQFDWICDPSWDFRAFPEGGCTDDFEENYRVKTNLLTGATSGWAWSDAYGWISFEGLQVELPPISVQAFISILASPDQYGVENRPANAGPRTAPLADAYQSWRVSVQFLGPDGNFIDESQINSLNVELLPSPETKMESDQLTHKGNPLIFEASNPSIESCLEVPDGETCILDEGEGKSFNTFVYSSAPTSNMLGLMYSDGSGVEYPADRRGCTGFYPDDVFFDEQCPSILRKNAVFFDRKDDLNQLIVDNIRIEADFNEEAFGGRDITVQTYDNSEEGGDVLRNLSETEFEYEPALQDKELSFRPAFRLTQMQVLYEDDELYDQLPDPSIPANLDQAMDLLVEAEVESASNEAVLASLYTEDPSRVSKLQNMDVYLRADVDSVGEHPEHPYYNNYLLIEPYSDSALRDHLEEVDPILVSELPDEDEVILAAEVGGGGGLGYYGEMCFNSYYFTPDEDSCPLIGEFEWCGPDGCADEDEEGVRDGEPDWSDDDCPEEGWVRIEVSCDDPACNMGMCELGEMVEEEEYIEPPNGFGLPFHTEFTSIDSLPVISGRLRSFSQELGLRYGQKKRYYEAENTLSAPTLEQYVCHTFFGTRISFEKTCYFTGYLPMQDRHKDPEDMLVIGAINRYVTAMDLFSDRDDLAVFRGSDAVLLRNQMYSEFLRLSQGAAAGSGGLNSRMEATGAISTLMNGRLVYAEGDVTIEGSEAFDDKTLVVIGGDVTINGNIQGGQLGIIAFEKNGVGGKVYIDPSITNLNVNFFLDGSLFSKSPSMGENGVPLWNSAKDRTETLKNQLYIQGSIIGENTVNGSSGPGPEWKIGGGLSSNDLDIAREYDINRLRELRFCYLKRAGGVLDLTAWEACDEGELFSAYRDAFGEVLENSVILEHVPPSGNMPVFIPE